MRTIPSSRRFLDWQAHPRAGSGNSCTNPYLAFHLSGSNDAALGGDLAYRYGKNGALTGMGLASAMQVLSDGNSASFGAIAQQLRPFSGLQEGLVKLA